MTETVNATCKEQDGDGELVNRDVNGATKRLSKEDRRPRGSLVTRSLPSPGGSHKREFRFVTTATAKRATYLNHCHESRVRFEGVIVAEAIEAST